MALGCIRATPWALSFLSPFELMYGCPFLLGQFPTASPLLEEYLPTLNLIRPLVREHAHHSLPRPHQTNPADLTLILGVLLKTLYYKALQPRLTGPFEVVLTIPQLLNWHVFTHHFAKMKVKVAQSCLTLCDHMKYSMEFSRPENWSGKPFSSSGDLPNQGIDSRSPALQADSLPAEPPSLD